MIVQVIGHNVRGGQLLTRVTEMHATTKGGSVPTPYTVIPRKSPGTVMRALRGPTKFWTSA